MMILKAVLIAITLTVDTIRIKSAIRIDEFVKPKTWLYYIISNKSPLF